MTLEILMRKEFEQPEWYYLRVDGISVKCSRNLDEITEYYDKVLEDPSIVKEQQIILKSQEIDVNL